MMIMPNVIGRQPYPGNPAVRDENGGLAGTWPWERDQGAPRKLERRNRPPDPKVRAPYFYTNRRKYIQALPGIGHCRSPIICDD